MFFPRSAFTYTPNLQPSILALSSDSEISEIRIRPFLAALVARGIISGFQFADRGLKSMGWHKEFSFTHIWCHRNVSTSQFRFLRKQTDVPIIYDIDDLLIAPPDFVKPRYRNIERIRWCLERADVITTSTDILRAQVATHALNAKEIITLKNGYAGNTYSGKPSIKRRIVWTSGDHPFVLREAPDFMERLAEIANRHGYEMILIGRFDPDYRRLFNKMRHIRRVDFNSYREVLRLFKGAIGLAPLPTKQSVQNQQFFDAKSDIKLLDYLCNGLVPVFTNTDPYARSELCIPELGAGDPDELLRRLDCCIAEHAKWIDMVDTKIHATNILNRRRFDELSRALDVIFDPKDDEPAIR